jgi:DNA-binding MarR family transcriptional regulator
VKNSYLEVVRLTERLHRQFLEVVKSELDRGNIEDINNVQALILFNIGEDELTVGELTNRGYYLGSNVSYNVRKMVENSYLIQERSQHDRRSTHVRLSEKGLALRLRIEKMFDRQIEALTEVISLTELQESSSVYHRLEKFWIDLLAYDPRTSSRG